MSESKQYAGMEYEDIVRKYADDITRMCIVWTGDSQAAEDCFQNTFLKLFETKKKFSEPEHIKAWLLCVAKNECRDYHRTFWNKSVDFGLDDRTYEKEQLEIDDDTRELVDALRKLPLKYRTVITLYYYEGYDTNEIAKILGTNKNTVKSRLRRARQSLAVEMRSTI